MSDTIRLAYTGRVKTFLLSSPLRLKSFILCGGLLEAAARRDRKADIRRGFIVAASVVSLKYLAYFLFFVVFSFKHLACFLSFVAFSAAQSIFSDAAELIKVAKVNFPPAAFAEWITVFNSFATNG